jgi:hypothetical protein
MGVVISPWILESVVYDVRSMRGDKYGEFPLEVDHYHQLYTTHPGEAYRHLDYSPSSSNSEPQQLSTS